MTEFLHNQAKLTGAPEKSDQKQALGRLPQALGGEVLPNVNSAHFGKKVEELAQNKNINEDLAGKIPAQSGMESQLGTQKKDTMKSIFGVLGFGTASSILVATLEGKYKFSEAIFAWSKGGLKGVADYLKGKVGSKSITEDEPKTTLNENSSESGKQTKAALPPAIMAGNPDGQSVPDENPNLNPSPQEEPAKKATPEEEKQLEVLKNYKIFSTQFYSYYERYQKALNEMDPDKITEKSSWAGEYIELAEQSIQLHNATVYELKQIMKNNKEVLNDFFSQNEQSKALTFGPFIDIKYDKEKKNSFMEYATDQEMRNIFYEGIDSAHFQAYMMEKWGISQDSAAYAEMGKGTLAMLPLVGTGMDGYEMVKHFYRGNLAEAAVSGGWVVVGAVGDVLLFVPATTAAGVAVKGARVAKSGVGTAKAVSGTAKAMKVGEAFADIAKGASHIKEKLVGLKNVLKKHSVLVQGGLALGDGVRSFYKTESSGVYYAGDEINYQDAEKAESIPPTKFAKLPAPAKERPGELKNYYRTAIEQLKGEMNWAQLDYEIIDENTVRIFRKDSSESIVLEKAPHDEATGWEVWVLKGLDKGYNDIYQAVAMANLLNHTANIIKSEDHSGGSENPFAEDDGAIDFDVDWSPVDLELFAAGSLWKGFYEKELGIKPEWVVNLFNRWYERNYN